MDEDLKTSFKSLVNDFLKDLFELAEFDARQEIKEEVMQNLETQH